MRRLITAILLAACGGHSSASDFAPTERAYWVQCMANAEHASTTAIAGGRGSDYLDQLKATRDCLDNGKGVLTDEQFAQLNEALKMMAIAVETRSITAHAELARESQKFLSMIP